MPVRSCEAEAEFVPLLFTLCRADFGGPSVKEEERRRGGLIRFAGGGGRSWVCPMVSIPSIFFVFLFITIVYLVCEILVWMRERFWVNRGGEKASKDEALELVGIPGGPMESDLEAQILPHHTSHTS